MAAEASEHKGNGGTLCRTVTKLARSLKRGTGTRKHKLPAQETVLKRRFQISNQDLHRRDLFAALKQVADLVSARFDHVLVDEYQDTNALQASILLALKPGGSGLTVVGDEAQSIYSFRSATVRNILDFPARFDPPATIVTLEQNYRSSQPILDACNRVISNAAERYTKNLFSKGTGGSRPVLAMVDDETAQVAFVVDRILANREAGIGLREQAVLFRASHHSAPLEVELTRRGVPFVKFGGLKFLEAAHVKDVIAVLRWAEKPNRNLSRWQKCGPRGL